MTTGDVFDKSVTHATEALRTYQANTALQEGAHGAAQSVSHAVAILRGTTSIQKPATPKVIA